MQFLSTTEDQRIIVGENSRRYLATLISFFAVCLSSLSCIFLYYSMGTQTSKAVKMASSAEIQEFIKAAITGDKVVVFSKSYCPYCTMAKEVFNKIKQPMNIIELNERDDGSAIQENLASITGIRTVPQVFVNGKCIGGGSDVKALHESGQLEPMLIG